MTYSEFKTLLILPYWNVNLYANKDILTDDFYF